MLTFVQFNLLINQSILTFVNICLLNVKTANEAAVPAAIAQDTQIIN